MFNKTKEWGIIKILVLLIEAILVLESVSLSSLIYGLKCSLITGEEFRDSFPGGTLVKSPPASAGDAGDTGSIPGSGGSPGGGHGNPLQYSCLGNPMDRGAWRATVHGVTKRPTELSDGACSQILGTFLT